MKSIPHDYYLRYVDALVYDEVLDFHCKGNFVFHKAFKSRTRLHCFDEKLVAQLAGNELHLYPDMDFTVEIEISQAEREKSLYRNESCERFSSSSIKFSDIEKLVLPLLSRSESSFKRGYPSGGALYPVEVFVCSLATEHFTWPCVGRVLHLLPKSRKFEVMQHPVGVEDIKAALLTSPHDIGQPDFAIIYMVYMPKNLFKYRYRGYRMALMEVGSMYMLIEFQAKNLGLACRLWSAYTDSMVCKVLGVNPGLFLPVCVHFVGGQHEIVK